METVRELGNNIRNARKRKNMSQTNLSTLTGISATTLSSYENNKARPGLDTLANIASALETTIDELYYGEMSAKPITTSNNEGELITNCVYALWKVNVLTLQYPVSTNRPDIMVSRFTTQLTNLIETLRRFNTNRGANETIDEFTKGLMKITSDQINAVIEKNNK